jgi:hypothetical protein
MMITTRMPVILVGALAGAAWALPNASFAQDAEAAARAAELTGRWTLNVEATGDYEARISAALEAIPPPATRGRQSITVRRGGRGGTGSGQRGVGGGLDRPAGSAAARQLEPGQVRNMVGPPDGIGLTFESVPSDTTKLALREGPRINAVLVLGAEPTAFEGVGDGVTLRASWDDGFLQIDKEGDGWDVRDRYEVGDDGRLGMTRRLTAGSLRVEMSYVYEKARADSGS